MKECGSLREGLERMEARAVDAEARAQRAEAQIRDLEKRVALADAAALGASEEIEGAKKDRREWTAQKARLMARLQAAERSCTDQHLLLYAVQQQLAAGAALISAGKPTHPHTEPPPAAAG